MGQRPTPAGAGSTRESRFRPVELGAYPRWRGEHCLGPGRVCVHPGLPPLARGAHTAQYRQVAGEGPTPAGAGSTRTDRSTPGGRKAYPRWRGEHPIWRFVTWPLQGLPPLARGARWAARVLTVTPGPTPAGAGSTFGSPAVTASPTAYPRWRGEHIVRSSRSTEDLGLPPLARGALVTELRIELDDGLPPLARGALALAVMGAPSRWPTPAGAGSTTAAVAVAAITRAYPRWRGEHSDGHNENSKISGLPPLARGAPCTRRPRAHEIRPTPAGAGSTVGNPWLLLRPEAYPRWRGEHSIPRCLPYRHDWPTPAGAGSTRRRRSPAGRCRAYPRWRGEHNMSLDRELILEGLPPLARGAPRPLCRSTRRAGPTPAGAGSTRSA